MAAVGGAPDAASWDLRGPTRLWDDGPQRRGVSLRTEGAGYRRRRQPWRPGELASVEVPSEKTSFTSLSLSFPIMARGMMCPQQPHGIRGPAVQVGEGEYRCA